MFREAKKNSLWNRIIFGKEIKQVGYKYIKLVPLHPQKKSETVRRALKSFILFGCWKFLLLRTIHYYLTASKNREKRRETP